MLILDFKSLETVLKMPSSKILFLEEGERIVKASESSRRNSEVSARNFDLFSENSMDLGVEDPFYDNTMRMKDKDLAEILEQRNMSIQQRLRRTLLVKKRPSYDLINRQISMVNRQNRQSYDADKIRRIFEDSKMTSKINQNKKRFFELSTKFKGVCLARCSPSMKSLVTEILCKEMSKIVLAIGDGGNDVGMIQISNVGVGIVGKEGNQAALAADFNITEFR